jgi:predicted TIM-barrel fold metal-dependent hydrolase
MSAFLEKHQAWLDQVDEEIVEPERRIIDPHHHLWHHEERPYLLEQLWGDTGSGHNIEKTVFVECGSQYREHGPEEMRPVGETEFVAEVAADSAKGGEGSARISAIVSHANLMLGDAVGDVLAAHEEAGQGLFRGIRHSGAFDPSPEIRPSHSGPPSDLYLREDFRAGVRTLARGGYSLDVWNFHPQIPALTELARAVPEATIVFDHFGGPLGIGPYEGKQADIYPQWKKDVEALSACENVVAKIGGMAMPINGWGWHSRETPATSDELVGAHRDYYLHTIDCFGPNRCMFESNFPVDRLSISYPVLWNALKKIAADFTEQEKDAMFYGTAARIYRLT